LIGDGQDLSTPDLVKAIAVAAHVRARLVPVPVWLLRIVASLAGRQQAVQRLCGSLQIDSSKARHLLGWTPVLTVQAGLNKAFEEIPE